MTKSATYAKHRRITVTPYLLIMLIACSAFTLWHAPDAAAYALDGLTLAGVTVIPSLFPQLILSDMILSCVPRSGSPSGIFRFLRLSPPAGTVLAVGFMCGFPIGARMAATLFAEGKLREREARDLAALAAVTGPAFVVAAVGTRLFGDVRIGWRLLVCELLASLLCLIVTRGSRVRAPIALPPPDRNARQSLPSLVGAVRNAAAAALAITGFIVTFSVICGFATSSLGTVALLPVCFLEVSNACRAAAAFAAVSPSLAGAAAAFAVGFGGLSAALQCALCMKDAGLSFRGYIPRKLAQGILTVLLFTLSELL